MAAKVILVFCAQALLIQHISGTSMVDDTISIGNVLYGHGTSVGSATGSGISGGFGFSGGSGYGGSVLSGSGISGFGSGTSSLTGHAASASSLSSAGAAKGQTGLNVVSGGPLLVTSISPIAPSGLAVASENGLEGVLTVSGQLPFLSAVAFEGGLPTAGSGVATCGCGNGEVGIVSEGLSGTSSVSNSARVGRRF